MPHTPLDWNIINLIDFVKDDEIDYQTAYAAFRYFSHVPDIRAKGVQREYREHIMSTFRPLLSYCQTMEQFYALYDMMAEYKREYARRVHEWLRIRANMPNPYVVGRSKLNTNRMKKATEREQKIIKLTRDWACKEQTKILKKIQSMIVDHDAYDEFDMANDQEKIIGEFVGGVIIDCPNENRIRIKFDAKPDVTVRDALKQHGWWWIASRGVWQHKRTRDAMESAFRITMATRVNHPDDAKPWYETP